MNSVLHVQLVCRLDTESQTLNMVLKVFCFVYLLCCVMGSEEEASRRVDEMPADDASEYRSHIKVFIFQLYDALTGKSLPMDLSQLRNWFLLC